MVMDTFTLTPEQEAEFRRIIQTLLDKKLDPIETAREFGVDIEQLILLRKRKPIERLRLMQSMAQFILKGRASIQKQKELAKHERDLKLRKPVTSVN